MLLISQGNQLTVHAHKNHRRAFEYTLTHSTHNIHTHTHTHVSKITSIIFYVSSHKELLCVCSGKKRQTLDALQFCLEKGLLHAEMSLIGHFKTQFSTLWSPVPMTGLYVPYGWRNLVDRERVSCVRSELGHLLSLGEDGLFQPLMCVPFSRSRQAWPSWAWSSVCCHQTWTQRWRNGRSRSTTSSDRARAWPAWPTTCTCSPGNPTAPQGHTHTCSCFVSAGCWSATFIWELNIVKPLKHPHESL